MKKRINYSQQIFATATINPQLNTELGIFVEVFQNNEGSIPHVHVYHDKSRNKRRCSIVRLDKPEYSTHHKHNPAMPKDVKEKFLKIMTQPWPSHIIQLSDGSYRPATGYEAAVKIWADTFEKGSLAKFNLDKNGDIINIDYSNI